VPHLAHLATCSTSNLFNSLQIINSKTKTLINNNKNINNLLGGRRWSFGQTIQVHEGHTCINYWVPVLTIREWAFNKTRGIPKSNSD